MTDMKYFIAAAKDDQFAIGDVKDTSKLTIVTKMEMYEITDKFTIGGDTPAGFLASLYSKKLHRWYTNYYRKSMNVIYKLQNNGSYHEMHAKIELPMCSVFSDDNRIIVNTNNDAYISTIDCMMDGFSGIIFDSVVWEHKMFLHAQTFKLYGDGMYFVFNYVGILNGDLSLHTVYKTSMSDIRRLERKYGLNPQSTNTELSDDDHVFIAKKLQLFSLNKREDGVYLDDLRIFGG